MRRLTQPNIYQRVYSVVVVDIAFTVAILHKMHLIVVSPSTISIVVVEMISVVKTKCILVSQ